MTLAEKYADLDVFLSLDHSQLEIRVLAQVSKDKLLVQLIQSGEDIHCAVGHELTGIALAKIKSDRETRTTIKGMHFGIIYGLGPKSLYYKLKVEAEARGESFKMSEKEVLVLYNRYFERFRGVKDFIATQVAFAQTYFYVETIFGFKREISQTVDKDRETYWKNQAVNSPIQGAAHQLLLIAMAAYEIKKRTYYLLKGLSMEIHDSLISFSKLADLSEAYKQGIQLMEKEALAYVREHWPELNWQVPLKAEAKAGFRLGVMVKDYLGEPSEEFLEMWCKENKEFEAKMLKQMEKEKKEIGRALV